MFERVGLLCLALCFGTLLTGCATMANTDQQVSVYTIPDGADVVIGDMKGVSPMSATVPGGYSIPHSIQINKEGYQSQTFSIQRGFRTSALVTDILPGILLAFLPLIVDAATGDFWYVANTSYTVKLVPVATGANGNGTTPNGNVATSPVKFDIR